jgi:hypothetical protein
VLLKKEGAGDERSLYCCWHPTPFSDASFLPNNYCKVETPALFSPAIFCLIFLSMDLDDRFLYKLCAFQSPTPPCNKHIFVLTFKLDPHSIIIFHVFYSPDIFISLCSCEIIEHGDNEHGAVKNGMIFLHVCSFLFLHLCVTKKFLM